MQGKYRLFQWILGPTRWGVGLVRPAPRIWWRLFDDSKRSALASVGAQTLATLLTALTARALGAEEYGRLAILTTCVGWFAIITTYPAAQLIPRFMAEGRQGGEPHPRKCATGFYLTLLFALAGMLLGLALLRSGLAYYRIDGLLAPGLCLCLLFPLAAICAFCLYLLQSSGHLTRWAWTTLLFGALPIGGLFLSPLLVTPLDVPTYALVMLLSNGLAALIGVALITRILGLRNLLHPDFSVARQLLHAGLGGFIASLGNTFALLAVATLVARQVGSTQLGRFQLILTLTNWVGAIVMSVSVPSLARWSTLATQSLFSALVRSFRFRQSGTGGLTILAGLLAAIFAPQVLDFLYGPAYRQDALLLRLFTPAWAVTGFAAWYSIALTAIGQPGRIMLPNLAWATTYLALAWALLRFTPLGVYGAVIAYVVCSFAWWGVYEIVFRASLRAREARAPNPA